MTSILASENISKEFVKGVADVVLPDIVPDTLIDTAVNVVGDTVPDLVNDLPSNSDSEGTTKIIESLIPVVDKPKPSDTNISMPTNSPNPRITNAPQAKPTKSTQPTAIHSTPTKANTGTTTVVKRRKQTITPSPVCETGGCKGESCEPKIQKTKVPKQRKTKGNSNERRKREFNTSAKPFNPQQGVSNNFSPNSSPHLLTVNNETFLIFTNEQRTNYAGAVAECQKQGGFLANVTIENRSRITSVLTVSSYIGSWHGDNYSGSCMVLTNEGSIIPTTGPACSVWRGFVCQFP